MRSNDGTKQQPVKLEDIPQIRRIWYKETRYYSVIDVIAYLVYSQTPRKYWNTLKTRLKAEGAQAALDEIEALPLRSADDVNPTIKRVWLNLGENAFVRGEKQSSLCSQTLSLSPDKPCFTKSEPGPLNWWERIIILANAEMLFEEVRELVEPLKSDEPKTKKTEKANQKKL